MKKYIKVLFLIIYISIFVLNNIFISNAFEGNITEYENGNNIIANQTDNVSKNVIAVVRIVAVSIAIIMLLVIAMRYMISAPSERADIKKHLIAYVIGAFIVFGVSTILGILVEVADIFNK